MLQAWLLQCFAAPNQRAFRQIPALGTVAVSCFAMGEWDLLLVLAGSDLQLGERVCANA